MSRGKSATKKRHPIVDSISNRADLKAEEVCHRRELAFPAPLNEKQNQALAALMAKRDLFL